MTTHAECMKTVRGAPQGAPLAVMCRGDYLVSIFFTLTEPSLM